MDTSLNVMSPGPKDTRRPTGLSRQLGIFDLVVEAGNPADSERPLPMLERHIAQWRNAAAFAHASVKIGVEISTRLARCGPALEDARGKARAPRAAIGPTQLRTDQPLCVTGSARPARKGDAAINGSGRESRPPGRLRSGR